MCKCSLPRILNSGALCWASQGVAKAGQGQGWWPGPEPWCPGVEAVPGSAKERPPGGLPPSTPHGHHPGAHGSSLRQGEIRTKLKPLICKLRILGDVTISSPGFLFFFSCYLRGRGWGWGRGRKAGRWPTSPACSSSRRTLGLREVPAKTEAQWAAQRRGVKFIFITKLYFPTGTFWE